MQRGLTVASNAHKSFNGLHQDTDTQRQKKHAVEKGT
jgi:hypothetical protein